MAKTVAGYSSATIGYRVRLQASLERRRTSRGILSTIILPLRNLQSTSDPAPTERDSVLKFSLVFANQEGQVSGQFQFKIRIENFFQGLRGSYSLLLAATQPFRTWGKLLKPGKWSGEQQLPAAIDKLRKAPEKKPRLRQATDQIGCKDDIEAPRSPGKFIASPTWKRARSRSMPFGHPRLHQLTNIALRKHLEGRTPFCCSKRAAWMKDSDRSMPEDVRAKAAKLES